MLLRVENRLKSEAEPEIKDEVKGKKRKKSKPAADQGKLGKVMEFVRSEQFRKISGLGLLLFSLFLLVAFISHFFTGHADQSVTSGGILGNPAAEMPRNWTGSIGAWFAKIFVANGFGIFGLLIPVWLGIFSVARLENNFYPLAQTTLKHFLFFGIWGSWFVSFFILLFSGHGSDFGGGFGEFVNESLFSFMNKFGTGVLLFLLGMVYTIVNFKFDITPVQWYQKFRPKTAPAIESDSLETGIETAILPEPPVFDKKETEDEEDGEDGITLITEKEFEEPAVLELEPEIDPMINSLQVKEKLEISTPLEIEIGEEEPKADDFEINAPSGDESIVDNIVKTGKETYAKIVPDEDIEALDETEDVGDWEQFDPTRELSDYNYPPLELLKMYDSGSNREVNRAELEENKNKIVRTLRNYNIEITHIKATVGPTVTLYEIVPAPGIRISKIKNLEDDIALSLAALGIRIIAPIPGKGTIGIEIPNSSSEIVSMRSVLATEKFRDTKAELPLAIGRNISNEVFIADLTKMPHLLIAGATGQGKSVGINGLITSILYKKHPAQVKFVLIDPKKVELNLYAALEKHFLAKMPGIDDAIITDTKQVIHVLNSICVEMDDRYDLLKRAKVRNIKEYNDKFLNRRLNPKKGHKYLPYIILIIDEFADLMMTAGKEIETPIARLAQLARAIGIHLVLATQRPSVNVITGIIKANFPARVSYRVSSKVDSRTILDTGGADQLIGRGDLLFSMGSDLVRIQNAFVDTPEVEDVVNYISKQRGYFEAYMLPEVHLDEGGDKDDDGLDDGDRDVMFKEAARMVVRHQQGSTSLIQRRLKLGYNRAGRIVDQLEKVGIVGPFSGSKARDVLFKDEISLEQFLNSLD